MTEAEYLSHEQPQPLLDRTHSWAHVCSGCQRFLSLRVSKCGNCGGQRCVPPSDRQLRLIAGACVRFCRDEFGDETSPAELEAAEHWGETGDPMVPTGWLAGLVSLGARGAATAAIRNAQHRSKVRAPHRLAATLNQRIAPLLEQATVAANAGVVSLERARQSIIRQFRLRDEKLEEDLLAEDRRKLCDLIRDVLGNPFRAVTVKPAWLTANRGLARTIAEGIAEEGRWSDLPILADALEEGGCDDERLLSHARQPRHYRGCWLIDAILGNPR